MNNKSIEPIVANKVNGWLSSYGLDYKLEQESLTRDIDNALENYFSKTGGIGGNRPDVKLLLQTSKLKKYPVLIEYKGHKDKLEKLNNNNQIENLTNKNEPNFKNINTYAVNGAVHYANAILHHTNYSDIIAIGITGYKSEINNLELQIGVYYVSKSNYGIGQKIGEYSDLSFLKKENFDSFIDQVEKLHLTQQELDLLKKQRENEIDSCLKKLNDDIYKNETGISESDRVYLVAASIIATLGIPDKVAPLEESDLKSSIEKGNQDGDIILRKITAFLNEKNIPDEKKELIIRTLQNTLTSERLNKPENGGESQLKRVFTKIINDLGIYYKIDLTTDFTGKLFNEMYGWLGFTQDKLNDVVLTPSYVATLLAKLAHINKDSYVWDFATGSAGLLVAAMNEMINDAKTNIKSPDELKEKIANIKSSQLLGIEYLPSIYMLSILNMILMGDGSSNILNKDSLQEFDGNYEYTNKTKKFPANAFVLNPPYSAQGNGMIFVEKAFSMMEHGYGAIIIQSSSGSGKAKEFNKKILQNNTLLASIKMPPDLFIGKSNVQTNIYVFKIGEKHNKKQIVKFIDFTYDGYSRTNRKKSRNKLIDNDHAKERYQEIVDIVCYDIKDFQYLSKKNYFEATIDPENGADWNKSNIDNSIPTIKDFEKTVSDYILYEISDLLKSDLEDNSMVK